MHTCHSQGSSCPPNACCVNPLHMELGPKSQDISMARNVLPVDERQHLGQPTSPHMRNDVYSNHTRTNTLLNSSPAFMEKRQRMQYGHPYI